MKALFPDLHYQQREGKDLFIGKLYINEDILPYRILIEYRGNIRPLVKVLSPAIKEDAPHRHEDGSLCLYRPDYYKWNSSKLLAKDIIPWTAAWIYFYEYWLQTGQWLGPEAPHYNNTYKDEKSF